MRYGLSVFLAFFGVLSVFGSFHPPLITQQDSIMFWANSAKDQADLSFKNRQALVNKAYNSNQRLADAKQKAINLSRISLAYQRIGDTENFRNTNKELIALATKVGDQITLGEAHWDLGDFFNLTKPDSAFYHYKEAYGQFSKINLGDKASYSGRMLLAIARIKENNKDYMGAEKDVTAAIASFKKINANGSLFNAYNQLAVIQNGIKKYDKALEYYKKAQEYLPFLKESQREKRRLSIINNIASVYLNSGDYKEAYKRYRDLEREALADGNSPLLIQKIYNSIAISGFKSGALSATDAMALIKKSNIGLDALGSSYDRARNLQYAAEIMHAENQSTQALAYALEARNIAEETGNNDRLLEVLKLLSQIDTANGAQHSKSYFELSDRLQLQERSMQDKFARIQLETDEIIAENVVLSERTKKLFALILGLSLIGLAIFIIIIQRSRNVKLRFRQRQQEADEEIYNLMLAQHGKMEEGKKAEQKRVSEELHDGVLGQMLGIRLVLSGLNERDDESAILQRANLIGKLQDVEEEIRIISHELSDSAYKKLHNFILSINDLVHTVNESTHLRVDFYHDKHFEWDHLMNTIKINTYRILQELLQNCVKHAKCKNVEVILQNHKNTITLTVNDDGIGFNDSKVRKGIGLKNIVSRVEKMDAQWQIWSKPNQGTKITITVPQTDLKKNKNIIEPASNEAI